MLLKRLIDTGIYADTDPLEVRYIRYTNIFSLMIVATNLVLSAVLYATYGPNLVTQLVFYGAFVFGSVLIFSSLRLYTFSRLLLSVLVPLATMGISFMIKGRAPELITPYSYFDTRTVLLGILVIPVVVFPVKNRLYLFLGTALPGIFIMFYDPIHAFFSLGYDDLLGTPMLGYTMSGMYYNVTYVFLVTGLLIFKFNNEKLVSKNLALVDDLRASNRKLQDASYTIHEQSLALIQSNKELSALVDQRTTELRNSNEELIKHNLELQQFSNTISHNLRGPVANLLGLAQLFELDSDENTRTELIKHIKGAAKSLDEVLKDLGKIIDIRSHLFQIKENIHFSEELVKVEAMLEDQIKARKAKITRDFQHDSLYGIRSYVNSILYNLISNAIKYHDPKRPLKIAVRSYLHEDAIRLEVEDNGVGIDLEKYGDKLFGMYKRFHEHTDGKGLGLFLTKQQIETIGGTIAVESNPGEGTKFRVTFPRPKESTISEQVFYESDAATIWFDAVHYVSTLVWKRKPTSEEYRDILTKNLEVFKTYKCDSCLADVRRLGIVSDEDRNWFVNNIFGEAQEIGLKKFIIVRNRDDGKDDQYFANMKKAAEAYNIFFDYTSFNLEEAKYVIRNTITGP